MLNVTDDAAAAIEDLVASKPDGAGLRITRAVTTDEEGNEQTGLQLGLADAPQPNDEVIPDGPVFLGPHVPDQLEGRTLDVDPASDQARFVFSDT